MRAQGRARAAIRADLDALLTVPELADLLGVSVGWVHDNHRRLAIPSLRLGGLLRFEPAAVRRWLDERPRDRSAVLPFARRGRGRTARGRARDAG
jgi:excisionase family DNA binding protein